MDHANSKSTDEWRISKNKKPQKMYQSPSITEDITKKGLIGKVIFGVKKDHC